MYSNSDDDSDDTNEYEDRMSFKWILALSEHPQSEDVCFDAIKENWRAIIYINNPTVEMYELALEKSEDAIHCIPDDVLLMMKKINRPIVFEKIVRIIFSKYDVPTAMREMLRIFKNVSFDSENDIDDEEISVSRY
jgi:hypothetical protein